MRAPSGPLTVVHLFLWGQLGVVVRLYLVKLFQDGCSARWGLCLVSGGTTSTHYSSYFSDLVPNMLGCFFIGFLSNHKTLGIKTAKPLAFLSHRQVFQQLAALHVGLRVGFCGCLTTFSSWELQMVTMVIGGAGQVSGQWAEAIWGWIIGTELAMVSLVFGEQMAQYCHKAFNKEEPMGEVARKNEILEPITGLEDQDQAYGHHGRQLTEGDPETNQLNRNEEGITGLGGQKKAHADSDRQQRQPSQTKPELRSKPKSYPKDDDPRLPTSDSFHRLADAAEADRQPKEPSEGTQSHGPASSRKLKSYPKNDDAGLPTSESFHRLADAVQADQQPEGQSPHSHHAAGHDQQALVRFTAGGMHEFHDTNLQDLTTTQSDIMDSHAALFSSNVPRSSPMDDMASSPHQVQGAAGNGRPGQQQQQRLHLQNGKVHDPGPSSQAAAIRTHDLPQHRDDLPPVRLQQKDRSEQQDSYMQQQQMQQSRGVKKVDDPGQADGYGQHQPGMGGQAHPGIKCRVPLPISCEAFWNGVAIVLAVASTALFVVLTIIDTGEQHEGRRSQWLAVLFAPFGAVLRWQLSKLNGRLPKPLTFFPAGTFAANMLACAFDFAVQSAIVACHPLSYWPSLVTTALKNGFMGSLSTVSTFATELRALFKTVPDTLHAYIYLMSTILGGVVLGVAIYGWADWHY